MAREWKHGDPIRGVLCPDCGGQVTYNGNYFCTDFGDDCDWALPDEEVCTPREKRTFNLAYARLMLDRGLEPKVEALWRKRDGSIW